MFAIVSLAADNTCNKILTTSFDAFSISSISINALGFDQAKSDNSLANLTASVLSGYPDISNLTIGRPNDSHNKLANSVLPTPVLPVLKNENKGFLFEENPTITLFIPPNTCLIARSWPSNRSYNLFSTSYISILLSISILTIL